MTRGEVWWAEEPDVGRRPVLILTRETAVPVLKRVVVVPATRRVRGIASEVLLTTEDGMPSECALSFDNLTTVPKSLLVERICRLPGDRLIEACRALDVATGC